MALTREDHLRAGHAMASLGQPPKGKTQVEELWEMVEDLMTIVLGSDLPLPRHDLSLRDKVLAARARLEAIQ